MFSFLIKIFFDLGFMALSRIFHLYRADHSSKVGENRRTQGKTTWLSLSRTCLSHIDPSVARNTAVRNLMNKGSTLLSTRLWGPASDKDHQLTSQGRNFITKTCLYNFDPLKPYFYIVKLGFTGVYIIVVISAQKHRLWVLVRSASIYVLSRKIWKISEFFIRKIAIFWW